MPDDARLIPDQERPGSWIVRIGSTDHSYIDPYDPLYLEFDYVQRIADVIDTSWPPGARLTVIHVGGGGMTIPRYIAQTRPTSGQIVLEPDVSLTEAVRAVAPLPKRSGIKVRALDGRTGVAALPDDYADLIVVDAFAGSQVPAELGTQEWFAELKRVTGTKGNLVMNLTDHTPFTYSRRVVAGVARHFSPVVLGAEPSTLKGRRFGNFVISAGPSISLIQLTRRASAAHFPYRLLADGELAQWVSRARPYTNDDTEPSPLPMTGPTTFR